MAETMQVRVFGACEGRELWVTETVSPEGDPRLEITTDEGDQETTVALDPYGVRKLRLALVRYERTLARGSA